MTGDQPGNPAAGTPLWRAVRAIAAGGVLAVTVAACGGASTPARSGPASRPGVIPSAVYQSAGYIETALDTDLARVKGLHVAATYTFPQDKLTIAENMNVLADHRYAGLITDTGQSGTVVGVGSHMYALITAGLLQGSGSEGLCREVCGLYLQVPASAGGAEDMGNLGWSATMQVLQDMTIDLGYPGVRTEQVTYLGQRAIRVDVPAYDPRAYLIVTDTRACIPLAVVDPGQLSATYTQWNAVPVPVLPAQIEQLPQSAFARPLAPGLFS